jgi:hypothetical protein
MGVDDRNGRFLGRGLRRAGTKRRRACSSRLYEIASIHFCLPLRSCIERFAVFLGLTGCFCSFSLPHASHSIQIAEAILKFYFRSTREMRPY